MHSRAIIRERGNTTKRYRLHPAQVVVSGFALTILGGTALLILPNARVGPGGASFLEALFTATSAVCVTGLTVVDTAVYWTPFGQVVILLLIQIGGFGIMSFASVVGLAIARKLSLRSRITAAAETKSVGLADVKGLVFGVVRISLAIEVTVALLLALRFMLGYGEPVGRSIWLGVFHSVSSFNNAGFALFSDNLMGYATDAWICLPIAAAVILGGLGFPVIVQLRRQLRRQGRYPRHWLQRAWSIRTWTMNTRIVVAGTFVLLVLGTAYITAVEWSNPNTLGPLDWQGKLLAGFFQSVQTRTAGFNSVDIGQLDSATLLGMDVLMLIGGGPAGTAGGIKITTFAVLFFILWTEVRGQVAVNVFGKRLSRAVHREAITIALLAVGVIIGATAALMLMTDISMDALLFEAISAFATVGLSTGITAGLPWEGQVILILLMFIGRLGPITFASAIALRERHATYELPKERPIIG
ncbi:TrkH family potassium uptake protein [Cryobacterium suzukii]|uniref:TrkH family potassium uptake protein n=1 Tax=Cryobacterium suzukii TaxID=1259198 RepID=A0A4R9AH29_9MICO|nr:potassium transporter TrkG [Cryobacterium suzukii]TFD61555.1 TrkH family potassium uptake protein [Cryobacterium suzukii]